MNNLVKKNGNAISVMSREEYLRQLASSNEPLHIMLTNDFAFKKIFKNKKVLTGFLMALLNVKEEDIQELEVIDPIEQGECEDEKEGILDIKIRLNDGQRINLELQNRYQEDWSERSIFYNCRMFVEGYVHGTEYSDMETCMHVGILNFNLMKESGFYHKILLLDEKTGELYNSKFQFHVIELRKLKDTPKEEQNDLYRWAQLIAAKDWETVCSASNGNPYREEVMEEMKKISHDEMQRYIYLREQMAISDAVSQLNSAKREGIREGIREGLNAALETYQECGFSKEDTLAKLISKFDLPKEEIEKAVTLHWNQNQQ